MKAVVAAFNQEKALTGALFVIVQLHRLIVIPNDSDPRSHSSAAAAPHLAESRVPALNTLSSIKLYFCHSWQWRAVPPPGQVLVTFLVVGDQSCKYVPAEEQLAQSRARTGLLVSWGADCHIVEVSQLLSITPHPTPHSHLTLAYNPAHSDSEEGSLGIVSKMNIMNRTQI